MPPSLTAYRASEHERHRPGEKSESAPLPCRTRRAARSGHAHFELYASVGVKGQQILFHPLAPVPRHRGAARCWSLLFNNTAALAGVGVFWLCFISRSMHSLSSHSEITIRDLGPDSLCGAKGPRARANDRWIRLVGHPSCVNARLTTIPEPHTFTFGSSKCIIFIGIGNKYDMKVELERIARDTRRVYVNSPQRSSDDPFIGSPSPPSSPARSQPWTTQSRPS